ncbi:hypothetical protein CPter91_3980 [Collimonas pratensis]|uniref:Uncharacterized protein n=1 Tax=Collimonas pratensis TaxID=279113 RepID=A0A127Q8H2_9BURK|nr:hypothetical protein CPter91_3980 [Collimonas pratensis]
MPPAAATPQAAGAKWYLPCADGGLRISASDIALDAAQHPPLSPSPAPLFPYESGKKTAPPRAAAE